VQKTVGDGGHARYRRGQDVVPVDLSHPPESLPHHPCGVIMTQGLAPRGSPLFRLPIIQDVAVRLKHSNGHGTTGAMAPDHCVAKAAWGRPAHVTSNLLWDEAGADSAQRGFASDYRSYSALMRNDHIRRYRPYRGICANGGPRQEKTDLSHRADLTYVCVIIRPSKHAGGRETYVGVEEAEEHAGVISNRATEEVRTKRGAPMQPARSWVADMVAIGSKKHGLTDQASLAKNRGVLGSRRPTSGSVKKWELHAQDAVP